MRTPRVTVVGAGSWATTVASLATRNAPALLWARRPELAEQIATTHENPDYLAGLALHPELRATSLLPMAAEQADVIIIAVPTHAFRQTLAELAPHIRPWIPVVSLSKGFEVGTGKRMTELIEEDLPGHPAGALSGPNLAKEVLGRTGRRRHDARPSCPGRMRVVDTPLHLGNPVWRWIRTST